MENKIARKYEPLIFVFLVIAYLLRYSYSIYCDFANMVDANTTTFVVNIFYAIFEEGIIPAAIAFFLPSIFYSVGFRRRIRCISRTDFVAYSMILTAIIEAVLGLFGIFSIIVSDMELYISMLEPTLFVIAFMLFYFLFIVKKYNFNPLEKCNAFKIWFSCLIVWQGIEVLLGEGILLFLSTRTNIILQLGSEYAYLFLLTDLQKILAIVEISLYFVFILVYFILTYSLKAKCEGYQNDEPRQEYTFRPVDNPFEEQKKDNNDDDHHDDINDIFGI